jgi:hypothetical protein
MRWQRHEFVDSLERALVASSADSVRLVVALAHRRRALRLLAIETTNVNTHARQYMQQ